MNVDQSCASTVVRAPAKINLFFEVLGKRGDGYHEIETLMVPIGLWDTLVASPNPSGAITLDCRIASAPVSSVNAAIELPPVADNLITKALVSLRQAAQIRDGLHVQLEKRIPTAAGLGGGSSDAAAALVAANQLWNLNWPRPELAALAAELGSDVPFFLAGGPAICRGRGERVEPVTALSPLHAVVVRPPEGLSTASVYAACRPAVHPQHVAQLLAALRTGDLRSLGSLLFNRLEEAASQLSPWVARLRQALREAGCVAVQMTGSGTACFGICRHALHARRVGEVLRARGFGCPYVVNTCA